MAKLSPMMMQYMQLKEQYKDTLLFFRLGDFYEMFFEDAVLASRELELTLTGRDCGMKERAPMCGVPYHAVDQYVNKLLAKGYKVAICEQMQDPDEADGLVERDVVRIITPGTVIETSMLDEKSNNYIVSIFKNGSMIGLAHVDVSTGEFAITEFEYTASALVDELLRIQPSEILANTEMHLAAQGLETLKKLLPWPQTPYDEDAYSELEISDMLVRRFGSGALDEAGLNALCAAGALMRYLEATQKNALAHINAIKRYELQQYMLIDPSARRNLELTQTLRGQARKGSLLWLLDNTATAMGARMLKSWLEQPLQSISGINARLDGVAELKENLILCDSVDDLLLKVKDIERIVCKISYGTINARDCMSLQESLSVLPELKETLEPCAASILQEINRRTDALEDVCSLLANAIPDNPPISIRDGGIIKEGYNAELDTLRNAFTKGREVIAQMEASEREATGIKNLRIGFNKVFGYYIEVTNSNVSAVPYRYTRKQTLANGERYITPELKELEDTVLHAEERSVKLEQALFAGVREALEKQISRMQATASAVASLDVLHSFARLALRQNYCRPEINADGVINIADGRHPVVERSIGSQQFVPNNTVLDMTANRFLIITGPNMAGKSTYLRQVALITMMAHMGCFVPARKANIAITDRIFTRVGASDDLFLGQSTFMVEMSEVASILEKATRNSLVILDEIGRGTSTFDGLSIAWAVIEHICNTDRVGAKALFATHYHELTELEDKVPGVKNYCISVKEQGDEVIFLRRIVRGGADKSFGIHVAGLAGLPQEVIIRAREILAGLEEADINKSKIMEHARKTAENLKAQALDTVQMSFMDVIPYAEILDEIRSLDITTTTPIDALYLLNRLKQRMERKAD
jgi:DNA mismatch repair protein MutS